MAKAGILCAADTELEPFLGLMEIQRVSERAMLRFYEGRLGGRDAVALYSGVCRVNAAIAAQLLIDVFQVDLIISAGTAGGMDPGVRLFDTVVSEAAAYHDMAEDILTEFHPWMDSVWFPADKGLLDGMREYGRVCRHPLRFGRTVTGEQFIGNESREDINARFSPLSVDMETAGIAHVCYVNRVPFLSVRTVTDTAEHPGAENFEENCGTAARISAEVVAGFLEQR